MYVGHCKSDSEKEIQKTLEWNVISLPASIRFSNHFNESYILLYEVPESPI